MKKLSKAEIKHLKTGLSLSMSESWGICEALHRGHMAGDITLTQKIILSDILVRDYRGYHGKYDYFWKRNFIGNIQRRLALRKIIKLYNKEVQL
jgi:hypothetical protein